MTGHAEVQNPITWLWSLPAEKVQAVAAVANILLTVGLLAFALMQWLVMYSTEKARRREREEEAGRAIDVAYQAAWAEQFRLESLSDQLDKEDLIELAVFHLLSPTDTLPKDPFALVQLIARLGPEAGYLAGVAMTAAFDTARQVAALNSLVGEYAASCPVHTAAAQMNFINTNYGATLAPRIDGVRKGVRELARLLAYAIQHSPSAGRERTLKFNDETESELGKQATDALAKRAAELQKRHLQS